MRPGQDCGTCNGRGRSECIREVTCTDCGGSGKMRGANQERDCYSCGGRGKVTCYECGGRGWVTCFTCGGSGKRS